MVGIGLDLFYMVLFFGGAAGDEDFFAEDFLLSGGQVSGTPLEEGEHAAARDGEESGIKGKNTEPFAKPDLPAGNGFDGKNLHLAFLDVASEGAAREPESGEAQQGGDGAEGVSEENLGKAASGAVIFDEQG